MTVGRPQPTKPKYAADAVRVSGGPVGRSCTIALGDVLVPVMAATVRIVPDEMVTVECTVRASDVDITALTTQTTLTVIDETQPQ